MKLQTLFLQAVTISLTALPSLGFAPDFVNEPTPSLMFYQRAPVSLLGTAAQALPPAHRPVVRLFARPRAKLPDRRVDIKCSGCGAKLFRYAKGNGASSNLVKVYRQRIVRDFTEGAPPGECPGCGATFAREAVIHGLPALKIVSGKVRMK